MDHEMSNMDAMTEIRSSEGYQDDDFVVYSESDSDINQSHKKTKCPSPKYNSPELNQRKCVIFEENLDELMKFCNKCGSPVVEKS